MSSEEKKEPPSYVTLEDGTPVHLNDYVYMASEYVIAEPYFVARVMEFLYDGTDDDLKVRVAWFYRPKDVTAGRRKNDNRVLFATMHSSIHPVCNIKSVCVVKHLHYISDLEQYKEKEDHFYYSQLFDRYICRTYEVVPCETIKNVPVDIAVALRQRYKFILAEEAKALDFKNPHRVCAKCNEWCPGSEAIKCAICYNSYHMSCTSPPITKKLAKGYAWQCAPCLRKLADGTLEPNQTSAKSLKHQEQEKEAKIRAELEKAEQDPENMSKANKLWPFRYFGIHSKVNDIFDYDDRIYPRAASRIGGRYQANIPDLITANSASDSNAPTPNSMVESSQSRSSSSKKRKSSRYSGGVKYSDERVKLPVRGIGKTSTLVFSKPDQVSSEELDEFIKKVQDIKLPVSPYSPDVYDRVLSELQRTNFNWDEVYGNMHHLVPEDLNTAQWTKEEIGQFERGIITYGHDLQMFKKQISTKTMGQIVRYFYLWKKSDRYQPVYEQFTKKYRPSKKFKKRNGADGEEKKEDSPKPEVAKSPAVDDDELLEGNSRRCINCSAVKSEKWYRSPGQLMSTKIGKKALCKACGVYWLKYGELRPLYERNRDGKGNGKKKRGNEVLQEKSRKKLSLDVKAREPPKKTFKPTPCGVCRLENRSEILLTCSECGLSVHSDCYGIQENGLKDWVCDPCANIKKPSASLSFHCVLCRNPETIQPHQALKKTIGNNWCHVVCATWIPEITFGDAKHLEPIEGIGVIAPSKWKQTCSICGISDGACVSCAGSSCKKTMHVYCAQKAGCRLGFEVFPVGGKKANQSATKNTFANNATLAPKLWCQEHIPSSNTVVDMTALNPETKSTALYMYNTKVKQSETSTSGAMRLSKLLLAAASARKRVLVPKKIDWLSTSSLPRQHCAKCNIDVSPMWWQVGAVSREGLNLPKETPDSSKICHKCYWECKEKSELVPPAN
ncbi:BAH-domain-containing protein [Basidiobolus meristosporus CBS 931.73]|uniref:BAH-domain-containing protein n=1 Tax=Basidiobolus meristosporus CBS 931.73 TaxID=1314790 RepID=A0A1Y1XT80_9FUNG|nr:BAH-domain-containing protein [Basidiobolus meristosporus CBS 931.73]|eukprot:ORX88969.1 BAH-domain-containing protein [Basidiobolus meristosporus CBS 931.73]